MADEPMGEPRTTAETPAFKEQWAELPAWLRVVVSTTLSVAVLALVAAPFLTDTPSDAASGATGTPAAPSFAPAPVSTSAAPPPVSPTTATPPPGDDDEVAGQLEAYLRETFGLTPTQPWSEVDADPGDWPTFVDSITSDGGTATVHLSSCVDSGTDASCTRTAQNIADLVQADNGPEATSLKQVLGNVVAVDPDGDVDSAPVGQ